MPQRRNPVAIEHARAIGSKALGQALALLTAVHNTPFGDIVDTEDDLQPLVFSMFRDATRAVKLVTAAMSAAEFNLERLETANARGWTTLTELADALVRDHGLPFRVAHRIAARLMDDCRKRPERPLSSIVADLSRELTGTPIVLTDESLKEILSPRHFVNVRRTPGGPAPEETARASGVSHAAFDVDAAWCRNATDALKSAERRLAERSAGL